MSQQSQPLGVYHQYIALSNELAESALRCLPEQLYFLRALDASYDASFELRRIGRISLRHKFWYGTCKFSRCVTYWHKTLYRNLPAQASHQARIKPTPPEVKFWEHDDGHWQVLNDVSAKTQLCRDHSLRAAGDSAATMTSHVISSKCGNLKRQFRHSPFPSRHCRVCRVVIKSANYSALVAFALQVGRLDWICCPTAAEHCLISWRRHRRRRRFSTHSTLLNNQSQPAPAKVMWLFTALLEQLLEEHNKIASHILTNGQPGPTLNRRRWRHDSCKFIGRRLSSNTRSNFKRISVIQAVNRHWLFPMRHQKPWIFVRGFRFSTGYTSERYLDWPLLCGNRQ